MIMLNYRTHGLFVAPQFIYKKLTRSLVGHFSLRLVILVLCPLFCSPQSHASRFKIVRMVKLALLSWLAAAAPVFSAPADVLSSLDARACTTPANSLKNPSFESSAFSEFTQPSMLSIVSSRTNTLSTMGLQADIRQARQRNSRKIRL